MVAEIVFGTGKLQILHEQGRVILVVVFFAVFCNLLRGNGLFLIAGGGGGGVEIFALLRAVANQT